ncbi:PREDICTED: QWRF motif-containing protein 3-like [Ipomoea nil]|uniref:QWRF motif-containing protein 3-like n=1 Tax=Ipomoea nil TaxID=35883 RepID=UPI000901C42A|nr:PREDICTED: QWRF motif-containing protein 3-like [Ipomoea nil]
MEFDQKPRKQKFREVSSRFLSPTSNSSSANAMSSPNHHVLSPVKQKPRSSTDSRKHKGLEKSGFMAKLWPSSAPSSQSSSSKVDSLGNHLGHERLKELEEDKHGDRADNPMFLNRQNSCLEFSRFEREKDKGAKENHRPGIGGSMSMRHTGKFMLPGRSSTSSSSSSSSSSKSSNLLEDYSDRDRDRLLPGRFSVDENALQGKNYVKRSDFLSDLQAYSESENTEFFGSPVAGKNNIPSYMAPTLSSRKAGIEVASKYMQDLPSKSRRWSSDSGAQNTAVSAEYSPKKASQKTAIKRTNSLGTTNSKCSASPGRSNSPPVLAENKGKLAGISTSKPPTSPSRVKGVGSFLSMGLELLKVKKSSSSSASSPLGPGTSETVHHLRLLHNRLMQWRYANARSYVVNDNIIRQAKNNSIYAWDGLAKLHHSVMQKKLQLQKEKMEMKLTYVLHSQIKLLEAWGDMERQHLSAISMTKDSLNSVVCSVPLVQGAKVEPQSTSMALRHASEVAASIKLMLSAFSPGAEKTSEVLKEIAEVVIQEKLLLEECLELFKTISALEIQERSLKCNIVQLRLVEDEYQFRHQELSWKTYLQHNNNFYY